MGVWAEERGGRQIERNRELYLGQVMGHCTPVGVWDKEGSGCPRQSLPAELQFLTERKKMAHCVAGERKPYTFQSYVLTRQKHPTAQRPFRRPRARPGVHKSSTEDCERTRVATYVRISLEKTQIPV